MGEFLHHIVAVGLYLLELAVGLGLLKCDGLFESVLAGGLQLRLVQVVE